MHVPDYELDDDECGWIKGVPGQDLRTLFEATKRITKEIVPKESVNVMIGETLRLLQCDRVSVFIYDQKLDMLILSASNLVRPIRIARGQGIAGHVYETQESVNIPDCYADPRFDPGVDKATGYHTRCLMAVPILDFDKCSLGVLQAINKNDGAFTESDELMVGHLAQQAGIAYRNAELYGAALKSSERSSGLLKMLNSLTQNIGAQSMILQMTIHANELVQADRCSVFMLDMQKDELYSVSTNTGKEIRIPKDKGIAGECCIECKLINIPDAYQDKRFNPAFDKSSGYHTQSILAVPVYVSGKSDKDDDKGTTYGVIQMINKIEFDGQIGVFDDDDVNVIETFSRFVATKLSHSSLFKRKDKDKAEGASAFGTVAVTRSREQRHSVSMGEGLIEEGDEDGDEGED